MKYLFLLFLLLPAISLAQPQETITFEKIDDMNCYKVITTTEKEKNTLAKLRQGKQELEDLIVLETTEYNKRIADLQARIAIQDKLIADAIAAGIKE